MILEHRFVNSSRIIYDLSQFSVEVPERKGMLASDGEGRVE